MYTHSLPGMFRSHVIGASLLALGLASIEAVSRLFEKWLERRHGVLTYRLTQVLTGHSCFGRFHIIGREETPGCHHCEDGPEDTVEHTVAVSLAWAEHRRVLVEAIGGGELSRPALVEAMVRNRTQDISEQPRLGLLSLQGSSICILFIVFSIKITH